ncbi:MAG: hypothetical protein JWP40_1955 [Blastococcus sp.]|jgi:hypothetical protein|nr:hypothetical protein [Blastococcus sp.]
MHHRRPRPSPSVKVRGALAGLSTRLSKRTGPMLAVTATVALTAGAALVVPAHLTDSVGMARLALAAVDTTARPTRASQATDAAPGETTARAQWTAGHGAGRHMSRSASATPDGAIPVDTQNGAAPDGAKPAATAGPNRAIDRRGDHRRQQPAQVTPPNPACTLIVPADPTTAGGLTTPYELTATQRRDGACHESNPDQSAFVEAAVLDLDTGALGVYHPLVVDRGTTPAVPPAPVKLPAHAVVGVWFGFNGNTLTLKGDGAAACVNGLGRSVFGQFAYCNAAPFFAGANAAIAAHRLVVPPLGTGTDGLPCPTTRDFAVVDQDQSDNLATSYRVIDGQIAQDIPAASGGTKLTNGSDEGLLAKAISPALGCKPFTAPDLTNGGATNTPALALNELSAAAHQAGAALVPTSDPMVQVDGETSQRKTNLYRAGVDMPALPAGQSPRAYCAALTQIAPARLQRDRELFRLAPSPALGSPNLFRFLQDRFQATLQNLNCSTGR